MPQDVGQFPAQLSRGRSLEPTEVSNGSRLSRDYKLEDPQNWKVPVRSCDSTSSPRSLGDSVKISSSRERASLREGSPLLLADADPLSDAALLTDHEAAPVEAAVAALAACLAQDVVAPTTAHAATAVGARAALVAQAAHGARRVQARLALAEVGRLLEIHQVCRAGPAAWPRNARGRRGSPPGAQLQLAAVAVVRPDEGGAVEAVAQQRPYSAELRCHLPAGLELAAA